MQVEFPEPKINLPAVGDEKAGDVDLKTGAGRMRLGLYLSQSLRNAAGIEPEKGRLCVFALPVDAVSLKSPTTIQLSAEREGVAPDFKTQSADVPPGVEAIVTALGGRVRTEVADLSPDTALETH
jgi:hypothetical protein